jgi:hypothetical protein
MPELPTFLATRAERWFGHGQSIQRQRHALLQRGLERKQIRCRAYWADGKRGL